MIRILSSFAIIVAAAAVIAGGTYSHFTDEAEIDATFSAGTVKLSIEDLEGETSFNITEWAPGDAESFRLDVKNEGSLDLQIAAEDITVSGTWGEELGDGYVTVKNEEYYYNGYWHPSISTPIVIAAEQKLPIKFDVVFDIDADDNYQGETYTGSLNVLATQADNMNQ